jgi:hypothetical protein
MHACCQPATAVPHSARASRAPSLPHPLYRPLCVLCQHPCHCTAAPPPLLALLPPAPPRTAAPRPSSHCCPPAPPRSAAPRPSSHAPQHMHGCVLRPLPRPTNKALHMQHAPVLMPASHRLLEPSALLRLRPLVAATAMLPTTTPLPERAHPRRPSVCHAPPPRPPRSHTPLRCSTLSATQLPTLTLSSAPLLGRSAARRRRSRRPRPCLCLGAAGASRIAGAGGWHQPGGACLCVRAAGASRIAGAGRRREPGGDVDEAWQEFAGRGRGGRASTQQRRQGGAWQAQGWC